MSLSPKQEHFAQEYLVDLNATQAAIRAGYSPYTAASQGERLLRNVEIAEAISAAQAARPERTRLTQDWVIARLVEVTERCLQAKPVLDPEGRPTGEYRFNASGATKALELLGKHLGMFKQRVELRTSYVARIPPVSASTAAWLKQCGRG